MGVPVDNIDVSPTSGSLLLAFSQNTVPATDTTATAVVPEVALVTVQSDGTGGVSQSFNPDSSAVRAHFVQGTDVIGVVTPSAILLYENSGTGYAVAATLASDGQLNDFQGSIVNGNYQVIAVGAATNRFFYTTGALDQTNGLPAFKHFNLPYEERIISFTAGDGGAGTTDDGGTGGSIKGLTYTQKLGAGVIEAGGGYNTFITTGDGGASVSGTGGRGGDMTNVNLSLNPGYLNDGQDDTDFALVRTGRRRQRRGGRRGRRHHQDHLHLGLHGNRRADQRRQRGGANRGRRRRRGHGHHRRRRRVHHAQRPQFVERGELLRFRRQDARGTRFVCRSR